MTPTELHSAADRLQTEAVTRREWARLATGARAADLHKASAQQFQDRADQVRSWARTAEYHVRNGQEIPPDVAGQIESATREFLRMAGS